MDYKELKRIINKYTDIKSNSIPINAFDIAQELNLRVKNRIEAKQDFADSTNPLDYSNGCLSVINGEYVIYHDEKNPYKNFTVAHELAHYMLHHEKDGAAQHKEANLLASALIAPRHLIIKSKIKSPRELSEKCQIPMEVAQNYWIILEIKRHSKKLILGIAACCAVAITGTSTFYFSQASTDKNEILPSPSPMAVTINTTIPSYEPVETGIVYITSSGEKYHESDCIYLQHKDNIIGIPISKAKELGYEACKVCL